jgi:uncharacterized protein YegL
VFVAVLGCGFVFQSAFQSAMAGGSWFSKARQATHISDTFQATRAAGDSSTTVFDLVISLYNDPSGDDDPNNDTGAEDQTDYERVIRLWADAVCEQSNQALKLGKVRIFRNGIQGSLADVVWNASEQPRARVSGFGVSGQSITFGDVFPNGCGAGCDINFLTTAGRREDGGYTLGHEFGHYVLGLYDEYRGNNLFETRISFPQTGDTPVDPSIMNSQWEATLVGGGTDFSWLNHSTQDNFEANTAQGRVYGESSWDVLIQEVGDDPKDGDRSSLAQRVHYTALDGEQPTAADGWVIEDLPAAQNACRSTLEIIWMQDDIEMQIVIDRSGSMSGDPFTNAKGAAQTLVDEVEEGNTALGVVSFDDVVNQVQAIVSIPDPVGTVKDDIKTVIGNLTVGDLTAMFDAAKLALDNLSSYATTNGTNAAQLVFLLSDGLDNRSTETQATVTAAYQAADVPLSTFAYGSFAPEGVLRELAEDTGGLFRASPTDLAEIQSAFLATKAALTSSAGILQESASIAAAPGYNDFSFAVDDTLRELSIFANHVGNSGDVSFSLSGPSGTIGGVSFACTEVSDAVSCSAAVDESTVDAAGTGEWTLTATNNTASSVDVNVDILATPHTGRTYDLVVANSSGTEVIYPNPIILTATVSQDRPITGVNIAATVTDPAGTESPITLVDTGANGDGVAGDGTYSAIFDYTMNGIYTIEVTIDNTALTAQFTTQGFQPAHILAPNEEGGTPTPQVFPPITENFTRTAGVQLVVSGVLLDDHPDEAPGTNVTPNNSDVPGRIEVTGDVDVFTVATTGLDHLIFRVTGLAFGMEPRLRILTEDGSTEIIAATIDQLLDGAAYLALAVPVSGATQLHAEVSHASGGTGTYQFSAGSRIASDPQLFELDIKPYTEENPIYPSLRGRIPVVVLGSEVYDVINIDVSTLAFGPTGAPAVHPRGGVFYDFNEDSLTDFLNQYRAQATGIAPGDEEACLSGEVSGVPFTACDAILTVP